MKKKESFYESLEFFDNVIDNVSPELGEHPCGLVLAPFSFLPKKESYDLGRLKGHDEFQKIFSQQPNITNPTTRADKGKQHKKTPRGWRKQADVAADFSIGAQKIRGAWYKKVGVAKVKDWETRYPDETKRESKSGYHAQMRKDTKYKTDAPGGYWEAVANWNNYWKKHNEAFRAWLKENPKGDHATFLKIWERPGKTVHMNDTDKTMRYGADTSLSNSLDSGEFDSRT